MLFQRIFCKHLHFLTSIEPFLFDSGKIDPKQNCLKILLRLGRKPNRGYYIFRLFRFWPFPGFLKLFSKKAKRNEIFTDALTLCLVHTSADSAVDSCVNAER